MGRIAKHREIKRLSGTLRADTGNDLQPIYPIVRKGETPAFLNDIAKEEYNRLVGLLSQQNVLQDTDLMLLTIYCNELSVYWESIRKMGDESTTIGGSPGKTAIKAEYTVSTMALRNIIKIAEKFGLTPADRPRIYISEKPEDGDPMEDLVD